MLSEEPPEARLAAVPQAEQLDRAGRRGPAEDLLRGRVQVVACLAHGLLHGDRPPEVGVGRVTGVEAASVQAEGLRAAVEDRGRRGCAEAALVALFVGGAASVGQGVDALRADLAAAACQEAAALAREVLAHAGVALLVAPAVALDGIPADELGRRTVDARRGLAAAGAIARVGSVRQRRDSAGEERAGEETPEACGHGSRASIAAHWLSHWSDTA